MSTPTDSRATSLQAATRRAFECWSADGWIALAYQAAMDYGYELQALALSMEGYVGQTAEAVAAKGAWESFASTMDQTCIRLQELARAREHLPHLSADFANLVAVVATITRARDFQEWPQGHAAETLAAFIRKMIRDYRSPAEVSYYDAASRVAQGVAQGADVQELMALAVTGCSLALESLASMLPTMEALLRALRGAQDVRWQTVESLREQLAALDPLVQLPRGKVFPREFEDVRTRLRSFGKLSDPINFKDSRYLNLAAAIRTCLRARPRWAPAT